MKITGKAMIFKNDYGNYSTSISNKKEDDTYESMYVPVTFKKGVNIPNKTKIDILDGFLSFYVKKDNTKQIKLVIMEFTTDEATNKENGTYVENTDELPF